MIGLTQLKLCVLCYLAGGPAVIVGSANVACGAIIANHTRSHSARATSIERNDAVAVAGRRITVLARVAFPRTCASANTRAATAVRAASVAATNSIAVARIGLASGTGIAGRAKAPRNALIALLCSNNSSVVGVARAGALDVLLTRSVVVAGDAVVR
jgi:hypothetical protein